MTKLSAEEYAEKQGRNLKNSIPDIRRGIERVSVAPGVMAAAKQEKMKANLMASIDSGKWANAVKSVSLQEWQEKALNKGVDRISTGIDAAYGKVVAFAQKLLPAVDAAVAKVKNMPDRTLQDSIARSAAYMTEMSKFKK